MKKKTSSHVRLKKLPHKLNVFTLTMINVAAILALHALPSLAEYGYSLVFYLGLAALCFLAQFSLSVGNLEYTDRSL